ncbi:hypothetical protein [uncultured Coprobacter sp.]|nr:hypothetical protein [uncultured Coprobacter sp.]
MGAIEKGGVVIMRIDAVQLALLCASHFIIFFLMMMCVEYGIDLIMM